MYSLYMKMLRTVHVTFTLYVWVVLHSVYVSRYTPVHLSGYAVIILRM